MQFCLVTVSHCDERDCIVDDGVLKQVASSGRTELLKSHNVCVKTEFARMRFVLGECTSLLPRGPSVAHDIAPVVYLPLGRNFHTAVALRWNA